MTWLRLPDIRFWFLQDNGQRSRSSSWSRGATPPPSTEWPPR